MTLEEIMLIAAFRAYKAARTEEEQRWAIRDVLQAITAASGGGNPPPLCPVHVTLEIDPMQQRG